MNSKTLGDLLKYSYKMNPEIQSSELYKILTENEKESEKIAKIMHIHKAPKKNYSNSDFLVSPLSLDLTEQLKRTFSITNQQLRKNIINH